MDKYLTISIICLLAACGTTAYEWQSSCRHNSILAASVAQEGYPTRVVVGRIVGTEKYHAQTQAKIDGEWKYIQVTDWPMVMVGMAEFELENVRYYSFGEYAHRLDTVFGNNCNIPPK